MARTRRARSADGPALARIDAATHSAAVSPAPPRESGTDFWGPKTSPDDVIVATDAGEVVGYVMLRQPHAIPSHAHVLEINGLAVDPGYQSRGIGRALVEAAVALARERGARKLSLRVLATNPAARRIYEAAGFEVEGVLRGEFVLGGVAVDDVLMARHLA